jgi:hypothetical protein
MTFVSPSAAPGRNQIPPSQLSPHAGIDNALTLDREIAMKEFVRRHEAHIQGVLSCFDRMLFRGYLPIMSGWSMAQFLKG